MDLCVFKAILVYRASSRAVRDTQTLSLKTKPTNQPAKKKLLRLLEIGLIHFHSVCINKSMSLWRLIAEYYSLKFEMSPMDLYVECLDLGWWLCFEVVYTLGARIWIQEKYH